MHARGAAVNAQRAPRFRPFGPTNLFISRGLCNITGPDGRQGPTLAAAEPPKRRRQVSLANNCVSVVAVKNASVAGVLVNKFPTRQRKRDKNHEGTYRYGFFLMFCLRCVAQPLSKSDKTRDTLFGRRLSNLIKTRCFGNGFRVFVLFSV
jgi:hypothetical protein